MLNFAYRLLLTITATSLLLIIVVANSTKRFIILAVSRNHSKAQNWNIIPRHPLANENLNLMNYEEGIEAIEWAVMDTRNYQDANCKSICMAECLAPGTVPAEHIFSIYVKTDECESKVAGLVNKYKLRMHVNKYSNMFPNIR